MSGEMSESFKEVLFDISEVEKFIEVELREKFGIKSIRNKIIKKRRKMKKIIKKVLKRDSNFKADEILMIVKLNRKFKKVFGSDDEELEKLGQDTGYFYRQEVQANIKKPGVAASEIENKPAVNCVELTNCDISVIEMPDNDKVAAGSFKDFSKVVIGDTRYGPKNVIVQSTPIPFNVSDDDTESYEIQIEKPQTVVDGRKDLKVVYNPEKKRQIKTTKRIRKPKIDHLDTDQTDNNLLPPLKVAKQSSKKLSKLTTNVPAKNQNAQIAQKVIDEVTKDDGIAEESTYCICHQISSGDMIFCENDLCPISWFHFNCVGLTVVPEGKWLCPQCKAKSSDFA